MILTISRRKILQFNIATFSFLAPHLGFPLYTHDENFTRLLLAWSYVKKHYSKGMKSLSAVLFAKGCLKVLEYSNLIHKSVTLGLDEVLRSDAKILRIKELLFGQFLGFIEVLLSFLQT